MSESTIKLTIDTGAARTSLDELSARLSAMKAELAGLNSVLDLAGKGGYSEVSEGMQKAKGVMASYRVTVDGVSHSYKELSTLSRGQVRDIVATAEAAKREAADRKIGLMQIKAAEMDLARTRASTAEAAKREAADRKTGLMQIKAAEMDLARTRASLSQTAKWESLTQKQQLTLALRHARASEAGADASLLPGLAGSQYAASLSAQVGGVNGLNQALATAAVAGRSASSAVDSVVASKGRLIGVSDAATTAVNKHTEAQGKMHAALRGVGAGFDNLWMTYSRYIGYMASAYGTVMAFRKATEGGIEFDYQSRFIAAVGDDPSPRAYKTVQEGLIGIKDAPANVNELASALRVLAQTGVNTASGLEILPTVIQAATLGEVSMKTASEDLIGVLEVFNMKGKDSDEFAKNFTRAGDVMTYVAKSTKANLHDVATTLQGVTGVAKQYGVALETAAAAATMLGKQGIVGSKAGTYQRQMWEEMYVPKSKGAEKAAQALDFTMFDKAGNLKDNLQGIVELVKKLQEYTPQVQAKLIDTMFSDRGGKQFRAIAGDLQEFLKQVEEAKNQTGQLGKATATVAESTGYQLKQLKADWDNLFIKSWDNNELLVEPIKKLREVLADPATINGLKTMVEGVTELIATLARNVDTIIKFGEVLAAAFGARMLVDMVGGLASLSGAMGPTITGLTGLRAALAAIPTVGRAALTLFGGWPGVVLTAASAMYIFRDKTAGAMEDSAKSIGEFVKNASSDLNSILRDIGDVSVELSSARLKSLESSLSGKMTKHNENISTAEKWLGHGEHEKGSNVLEQAASYKEYVDTGVAGKHKGQLQTLSYHVLQSRDKYKIAEALLKENEDIRKAGAEIDSARHAVFAEKIKRDALAEKQRKSGTKGAPDLSTGGKGGEKALAGFNPFKDARSLHEETYSSSIKQEKLRLGEELVDIEIELAAQTISGAEATRRKNEATLRSLNIEKELIGVSFLETVESRDRLQIEKRKNDIAENSIAIRKQEKQAVKDLTAERTANANAIEDGTLATTRAIEDMQSEQREFGLTTVEVRKLRLEREQLRKEEDLSVKLKRGQIDMDVYMSELQGSRGKTEAQKANEDLQGSFEYGWRKAFDNYQKEATDTAKLSERAFSNMASSMEDALVKFATTGKLSFQDFSNVVIQEIARMHAKMVVSGLASGVMSWFGGGGYSAGTTEYFSTLTDNANALGWAKGGVFDSASLSAYSNQIHDTPKLFAFARGAGVFAEAGPEAIMPLIRGSDGNLGVRAHGGGGGGNMIVNIINKTDNTRVQQTQRTEGNDKILDVIIEQIKNGIGGDISRGSGAIPSALESTYGLNRVAGAY